MNKAEITNYRKLRDVEIEADRRKTQLFRRANDRNGKELFGEYIGFTLRSQDRAALIGMYIAQAKASHFMIQRLMQALDSDSIGAVTVNESQSRSAFTVSERVIKTAELGEYEASSSIWREESLEDPQTFLSLAYLHSQGPNPNWPDDGRTEIIIDTQLDKLDYDHLEYLSDDSEVIKLSSKRELVAEVCRQVGVEVVPVTFEPVTAD